jgi:hypothetical protein
MYGDARDDGRHPHARRVARRAHNDYRPFSFNAAGASAGIDVDLATRLAQELTVP